MTVSKPRKKTIERRRLCPEWKVVEDDAEKPSYFGQKKLMYLLLNATMRVKLDSRRPQFMNRERTRDFFQKRKKELTDWISTIKMLNNKKTDLGITNVPTIRYNMTVTACNPVVSLRETPKEKRKKVLAEYIKSIREKQPSLKDKSPQEVLASQKMDYNLLFLKHSQSEDAIHPFDLCTGSNTNYDNILFACNSTRTTPIERDFVKTSAAYLTTQRFIISGGTRVPSAILCFMRSCNTQSELTNVFGQKRFYATVCSVVAPNLVSGNRFTHEISPPDIKSQGYKYMPTEFQAGTMSYKNIKCCCFINACNLCGDGRPDDFRIVMDMVTSVAHEQGCVKSCSDMYKTQCEYCKNNRL